MKNRILATALLILIGGGIAAAQEKDNRGEKVPNGTTSASVENAERLQLAYSAAKYGRQTQNADALILAAGIVKEFGAGRAGLDAAPKTEGGEENARQKATTTDMKLESLLADARRFAKNDKAALKKIKAVENMKPPTRGAVGGERTWYQRVRARSTQTYEIEFRGGEEAIVAISGDGDTDLDLFVYDEYGNLVDSDTDYTDDCVVRFYPRRAGYFTIKVENNGTVYNDYAAGTN